MKLTVSSMCVCSELPHGRSSSVSQTGQFPPEEGRARVLAPDPDDDSNNILAQIRQGVRLRKVRTRPEQQHHAKTFLHSADPLTRSIHEALRRIKEASPESESEDEGLPCTDWEN